MMKRTMIQRIKRQFAFLLIVCLCISMIPHGQFVYAAETKDQEIAIGDSSKVQAESEVSMPFTNIPSLSKDSWTIVDGKWKKIMDIPGMDITSLPTGNYSYVHKPNPIPTNIFFDSGSGTSTGEGTTAEVKETASGKVLELKYNDSKPHNLKFLIPIGTLSSNYSYELYFKYSSTPANVTISAQNNGQNIKGTSYDLNKGVVNNQTNPSFSSADVSKEGYFTFELSEFKSGKIDIKMWSGANNAAITIEKLELVAVSEKKPGEYSDKQNIVRSHDLIVPKNAGDFENWDVTLRASFPTGPAIEPIEPSEPTVPTGPAIQPDNPEDNNTTGSAIMAAFLVEEFDMLISSQSALSMQTNVPTWQPITDFNYPVGFSKNDKVSITTEEANMQEHAVKLSSGGEMAVHLENLEPNTEYSIFFYAKSESGNLEFRLSGFKDNSKFLYDNGDYNGSGWNDKANMYNWLENLKINANRWALFRYDFTTGSNPSNSVLARFAKKGNGNAFVDDIYIVKKSNLNETSYILPSNDQLSRGNRILIDQGLQFMSWITTDVWQKEKLWIKVPALADIKEMGLTAVQYNDKPNFNKTLHEEAAKDANYVLKWAIAYGPHYSHLSGTYQDNGDGKTGMPTEEEWANGYMTAETGLDYIRDLVSVCIGDEEDYSDTLIQNLKSWFELIREKYDKTDGRETEILLHHNEVGNTPQENLRQISTFNKDMLRKYVRTAKPDMITFDMYYFRERRLNQTKGGSVVPFYNDLNRYRIVASEGLDGSGEQPIPFGLYTYAWRTGPGAAAKPFRRGDGWYEMTQSQINLYTFAPLAFGAKWLGNFRWLDDNPSYLFSDYKQNPDGTTDRYYLFDVYKEMYRQGKNLGPHLVRLNNEEVAIVRGKQMDANGTVVLNNKPEDNKDWKDIKGEAFNQKVHIKDITVENLGEQNDKLPGDIFISYFKPLTGLTGEDKKVFTCSDPKYFMILNGLTAGDGLPAELQQGSSYETRQQITITFDGISENAKLMKVSRVAEGEPGSVVEVPLTDNKLITIIGGGLADLYYWEEGTANTETTTKKIAKEQETSELIIGEEKYVNEIKTRDLGGRTVTIGTIKGCDDLAPEANMAANINTPAAGDLVDGKKISLSTYATPAGNIGAIGTRYYRQDIWEMRIKHLEENNNVKLEFKDYDWTKEQLLEKIKEKQAGKAVADWPDLLVVPDEWLWSMDGLLKEDAVYSMQSFLDEQGNPIFDLTQRKWNQSYIDMATKDGKTYGAITDLSRDVIGMFVNKSILNKTGSKVDTTGNKYKTDIYNLQKQEKWTFSELEKIIEGAITNKITEEGIFLFADNDYLLRQLLVSAGVTQDPYQFDANSEAYQKAISLYNKLKENNLLLKAEEGENALPEMEQYIKAFHDKKVIFLMAPYTEVAKHLSPEYWYYEDNTIRKTEDLGGVFGEQTFTGYPDEDGDFIVTVHQRQAGKYPMTIDDWNFMLFPKVSETDNYRAIINHPSYPVLLKGTDNAEDIAFIWNELDKEYIGVNLLETVTKRGGEDYPDGRFWEGAAGDVNHRDLDSIRKAALRDGYGDTLKASGMWDAVLSDAMKQNLSAEDINKKIAAYTGQEQKPEPDPEDPNPENPSPEDPPYVPSPQPEKKPEKEPEEELEGSTQDTQKPVITPVPTEDAKPDITVESKVEQIQEKNNSINVTVKIAEEDIIKEEKHSEQNPLLVAVILPTEKLEEMIVQGKNLQLQLVIPEKIAKEEAILLSDIILSEEFIQKVSQQKDVSLSVEIKKETGDILYSWQFDKESLKEFQTNNKEINLGLNLVESNRKQKIDTILTMDKTNPKGAVLSFRHSGLLPANTQIRVKVDETIGNEGDTFYLYYFDPVTKLLLELKDNSYQIKEGYLQISINHCSNYVLLPKKADNYLVIDLMAQIQVTPESKLLYTGTKGNFALIEVKLPEHLKKADSITYQSSNVKIVQVLKNGKIKAKKAGSATITVSVQVGGSKQDYKVKVTVKDPYLTISGEKTLKVGDTNKYSAKAYGISGTPTFSISDSSIAVVNEKTGVVQAKKAGSCYLTSRIGEVTKSIKLTVE